MAGENHGGAVEGGGMATVAVLDHTGRVVATGGWLHDAWGGAPADLLGRAVDDLMVVDPPGRLAEAVRGGVAGWRGGPPR